MNNFRKLIEGNFPCEQVGAETRRERGSSNMLPPVYYLHVWWARRPLTPSRAAILGGIYPDNINHEIFLKNLGIVKKQAVIGKYLWTLTGKNLKFICSQEGKEYINVTKEVILALEKENTRRRKIRESLRSLSYSEPELADSDVYKNWFKDNDEIDISSVKFATKLKVITIVANPAKTNQRIKFASSDTVVSVLGKEIRLDDEDRYGYDRAYSYPVEKLEVAKELCVLDPTAGGGSIPFEALRVGCKVIANDLNPVASAIQLATLKYPAIYGEELSVDIAKYADILNDKIKNSLSNYFPCQKGETNDGYIFHRSIVCPYCGERVPLLNSFVLHNKADGWMVVPKIQEYAGHRGVRFVPTKLVNGKGPNGENPSQGTVKSGIGTCIFCGQTIESEEIKRQAKGISEYGQWSDDLYCVVVKREQPKLDKNGNTMIIKSGPDKGKIKTETVTAFREPVQADFEALNDAKKALENNWDRWESMGLIPTEKIPVGHKTAEPLRLGVDRWCDMFTPRQLLCHLTALEHLKELVPIIIKDNGIDRGSAIIHYLQYMFDKCLDYNSRQTLWNAVRGVIAHTFTRHDFSHKWTFGEMFYTSDDGGFSWGKNQIIKCYKELCGLLPKITPSDLKVLNGSAANLEIDDKTVDIICIDPPYYNNVQYAELSDFFYVWEKRIFNDIYPEWFGRRLTNKSDEAVANPVRDGGTKEADTVYESRMSEIFGECRRVLKDDGIMTVMFTHKTQEAWQTLTMALIENGWIISSAFPVESEDEKGIHHKDIAAAASSIFITCRKRNTENKKTTIWRAFGGSGVLPKLREAVKTSLKEYETLHLNAVDEMVASYGSALKVLSENWPVMDGDELVSPLKAMREASTVVAQYQMTKLTEGRLGVEDVTPEAGIVLTLFGIYGMSPLPYDDARNISNSLNIELVKKAGGYTAEGRMIGINDDISGRRRQDVDFEGYHAPVVSKGNKLRLVLPEERHAKRLQNPQTEWDIVQGIIMAYREGDVPVARAYMDKYASGREEKVIGVLKVWADGCGSDALRKEAQRILFGFK